MATTGLGYFFTGVLASFVGTGLLFLIVKKRLEAYVDSRTSTKAIEAKSDTTENRKTVSKVPSGEVPAAQSDSPVPKSNSNCSYRIEEENSRAFSSEYTRRGQLWSRHASWHLPLAPRIETSRQQMEAYYLGNQGLDRIIAILQKYNIDMITGFLPPKDPLQRLPYARYHLWEDLGDDLPKLLGARLGQARDPLSQLPVLSTDKLITDAELRRAHLLLCLFAHAYVWGGTSPIDRIPKGIAIPLCEISDRLGVPPVLGHPSIVLYNWRRLDAKGEICMENLATLNNFFDGRDESWFYLITVEIEARGAPAIVPTMLAIDAIQRFHDEEALRKLRNNANGEENERAVGQRYKLAHRKSVGNAEDVDRSSDEIDENDTIFTNEGLVGSLNRWRVATFVTAQLLIVAKSIDEMTKSILSMREGCHPFIFYHRVRPFLSAWKHNPAMPKGVIYEGVSEEPMQFYGGSAAQSALLPFLDIALDVSHDSNKSRDFLMAMRDYMLRPHREFLVYLESIANIRAFVSSQVAQLSNEEAGNLKPEEKEILLNLRDSYDQAVIALQGFRSGHINIVAEYIIAQQRHSLPKGGSLEGSAGGRGTGGTELMSFLKPIRDDVVNRIMKDDDREQATIAAKDSEESANAVSTIEVLRHEKVATATLMASKSRSSTGPSTAAAGTAGTDSTSSETAAAAVTTAEISTSGAAGAAGEAAPLAARASTDAPAAVSARDRTSSDVYYKDNGRSEDIDFFHNSASEASNANTEA